MISERILTITDIQTSELLYYDPDMKDRCYKFCAERNIDCLPAMNDPRQIFLRDEENLGFKEEHVSEDRTVNDDFNIFDPEMLEKFRIQPLLMVYYGNDLRGVVHFCDYNKPVVSLYLYELFFAYEKALRTILIQHGLKNEDMISYFKGKKEKNLDPRSRKILDNKISDYEENGSKTKLLPFEVFYLADLTALINHKKIIFINDFTKLRNMVMHANEFVHMLDPTTDDFIYDFKPFEEFFKLVVKLHIDFRRVSNRLAFTN